MSEQLSEEQKKELVTQAREAFNNEEYSQAIDLFKIVCEQGNLSSSEWQLPRFLIKAYQENGQLEEAISLCEELVNSDNLMASMWAREFLPSLSPPDEDTEIARENSAIPESKDSILEFPSDAPVFEAEETVENTPSATEAVTFPSVEPPIDDSNPEEMEPMETTTKMKRVMEVYSQAEKEKDKKSLELAVFFISALFMVAFLGLKGFLLAIILGIGYFIYSSSLKK
jgi:tetratricopeptide (TPR) repeat protein